MLRIHSILVWNKCPIVGRKFGNQTPVYQPGPLSPVNTSTP
jgi:hypothetical protein